MLNVLIIEDKNFTLVSQSLNRTSFGKKQNINLLNTDEQKVVEGFEQAADVLTAHKDKFDLLIIDLLLPDENNLGLLALQDWITENDLEPEQLNFGIIAVTSYLEEQAKKTLGEYPLLFGNSFLGLAPKEANLTANLERIIENSFFTPPFVRGGSKYFNTKLIRDKFKQFDASFRANCRRLGDKTIHFKDVFAIEESSDNGLVLHHTVLGALSVVNILEPNGHAVQLDDIWKNFCNDPAKVGTKREYHVPFNIWDDEKEREIWWEQMTQEAEVRIFDSLNNFPVFVHIHNNFAVNTLYLTGAVQKFIYDPDSKWNHLVGNPKPRGLVGLKINKELEFFPVNGRQGEIKRADKNVRVANAFNERNFALNLICSETWQPLLQQIRNYLGVK